MTVQVNPEQNRIMWNPCISSVHIVLCYIKVFRSRWVFYLKKLMGELGEGAKNEARAELNEKVLQTLKHAEETL